MKKTTSITSIVITGILLILILFHEMGIFSSESGSVNVIQRFYLPLGGILSIIWLLMHLALNVMYLKTGKVIFGTLCFVSSAALAIASVVLTVMEFKKYSSNTRLDVIQFINVVNILYAVIALLFCVSVSILQSKKR